MLGRAGKGGKRNVFRLGQRELWERLKMKLSIALYERRKEKRPWKVFEVFMETNIDKPGRF